MAIKIGKWYITKNNPREILNISREKQDRIDSAIEYLKKCYSQPENIENFMTESEMNYLLNILQNGSDSQ